MGDRIIVFATCIGDFHKQRRHRFVIFATLVGDVHQKRGDWIVIFATQVGYIHQERGHRLVAFAVRAGDLDLLTDQAILRTIVDRLPTARPLLGPLGGIERDLILGGAALYASTHLDLATLSLFLTEDIIPLLFSQYRRLWISLGAKHTFLRSPRRKTGPQRQIRPLPRRVAGPHLFIRTLFVGRVQALASR